MLGPRELSVLLGAVLLTLALAACQPSREPGHDPSDRWTPGLSLFNQHPDGFLPVTLESMLLDGDGTTPEDVYFAAEAEGVGVWVARASDGSVCVLYEFMDPWGGAGPGGAGGSCGVSEDELVEGGAAAIYVGAGSRLLAVGVAVDGFEEVVTAGGARYPVVNNVFVAPLLPVEEGWLRGTQVEFDSFRLEGPHRTLSSDQLLLPRARPAKGARSSDGS